MLTDARKSLYRILAADEDEPTAGDDAGGDEDASGEATAGDR